MKCSLLLGEMMISVAKRTPKIRLTVGAFGRNLPVQLGHAIAIAMRPDADLPAVFDRGTPLPPGDDRSLSQFVSSARPGARRTKNGGDWSSVATSAPG
jgi:hypothetical protein